MFGYIDEAVVFVLLLFFLNTKSHRLWVSLPFLRSSNGTSSSERRHAVQVKVASLRAAEEVIWDHFGAVAVLICTLWRLVGIIVAYLLVILLFFNASVRNMQETYIRNKYIQYRIRTTLSIIWYKYILAPAISASTNIRPHFSTVALLGSR